MKNTPLLAKFKQIFHYPTLSSDTGIFQFQKMKSLYVDLFIDALFEIYLETKDEVLEESSELNKILQDLILFFGSWYEQGFLTTFPQNSIFNQSKSEFFADKSKSCEIQWVNQDQIYVKTLRVYPDFKSAYRDISFEFKLGIPIEASQMGLKGDHTNHWIVFDSLRIKKSESSQDDLKKKNEAVLIFTFQYRNLHLSERSTILEQFPSKTGKMTQSLVNKYSLRQIEMNSQLRTLEILNLTDFRIATENFPSSWIDILQRSLRKFTQKKTFDFFIHKDLHGFLHQRLTAFLQSKLYQIYEESSVQENMLLFPYIRVFQSLSSDLIDFLAKIEQKVLDIWENLIDLQNSHYVGTLGQIPPSFYPEIAQNNFQREKWQIFSKNSDQTALSKLQNALFQQPLNESYKQLPVDTQFFSAEFTQNLLLSLGIKEPFLAHIDGILIQSDNYRALSYLHSKLSHQIKCIYIDPPYNTPGDDFVYVDSYNRASWLTLIRDRILAASSLLHPEGILCVSIDDNEFPTIYSILRSIFGESVIKTICVKMAESTGVKMRHVSQSGGIAKLKEYVILVKPSGLRNLQLEKIPKLEWDAEYQYVLENISHSEIMTIKQIMASENASESDIKQIDELLAHVTIIPIKQVLPRTTMNSKQQLRWKRENAWRIVRTVSTTLPAKKLADQKRTQTKANFFAIQTKRKKIYLIKNGYNISQKEPRIKILFADDYLTIHPGDLWVDIKTTGLDREGNITFKNGKKPEKLLQRLIRLNTCPGDIVLDFFAGSGTTMAVAQKLHRKWIGIEHDTHIFNIAHQRMQNVLSGDPSGISKDVNWKGGGTYMVQHLTSFEETLSLNFTLSEWEKIYSEHLLKVQHA